MERGCASAAGERGGVFLAGVTRAERQNLAAPLFPLDRLAVAWGLCRRSLSTERFLLRSWQGHQHPQRLGRRHSDPLQGLKSVGHACGCHSFRIPVLPSVCVSSTLPFFPVPTLLCPIALFKQECVGLRSGV